MTTISVLKTLLTIILIPFFSVIFVIFLVFWFILTVTGIGPLLHYYYCKRDDESLNINSMMTKDIDILLVPIPPGVHSCATNGYNIFAIYSKGKRTLQANNNARHSICIPNGLGATAILISNMQEKLVELGYNVLSFDRLGVGLSSQNTSNKCPSAIDVVNEMHYVMKYIDEKFNVDEQNNHSRPTDWVLIGPSMGSIVAQAFLAVYGESSTMKIKGFLNLDGLPYPFISKDKLFGQAALVYKIYGYILWTGILRPFIGQGFKSVENNFKCSKFTVAQMIAQINRTRFFSYIGVEMTTMMSCCELVNRAWGAHSVLMMKSNNPDVYDKLVRLPPTASYIFEKLPSTALVESNLTDTLNQRKITDKRSVSERGTEWISIDEIEELKKIITTQTDDTYDPNSAQVISRVPSRYEDNVKLPLYTTVDGVLTVNKLFDIEKDQNATTISTQTQASFSAVPLVSLSKVFRTLVVRVMSARNHDFGNEIMNSFYHQELRDMAAAEHSQHMLYSHNGRRFIYPEKTHMDCFALVNEIGLCVDEIFAQIHVE